MRLNLDIGRILVNHISKQFIYASQRWVWLGIASVCSVSPVRFRALYPNAMQDCRFAKINMTSLFISLLGLGSRQSPRHGRNRSGCRQAHGLHGLQWIEVDLMFISPSWRVVLFGILFLVADDANGRRAPSSAVGQAIKIGRGQHQTCSDDELSFGQSMTLVLENRTY